MDCSVLPEAVLHYEIIQFFILGDLEKVLSSLLTELQVHIVCVKPHLYNLLLLFLVDIAGKNGAEEGRLALAGLQIENLKAIWMLGQEVHEYVLQDLVVTEVRGIVDYCPVVARLTDLLSD